MAYFLFKTEPDAYSFDDFLRDKETVWDGVTNPTAVKNLREMPKGTKWIFYHTGDERRAVGTGTVASVDASDPKVPVVRVKVGKRLKNAEDAGGDKSRAAFQGFSAGQDRPALGGAADGRAVGVVSGVNPRSHPPRRTRPWGTHIWRVYCPNCRR